MWIKTDGTLYETPEGHDIWAQDRVAKFTGKDPEGDPSKIWQKLTGEIKTTLLDKWATFVIHRGVTRNQLQAMRTVANSVEGIGWIISGEGMGNQLQGEKDMPVGFDELLADLRSSHSLRESKEDMIVQAKKLGIRYDGSMKGPSTELYLFTDPVTKTTFGVKGVKDVSGALARARQRFPASEKIKESIIDYPVDGLCPEIWEKKGDKYSLIPIVRKKILLTLQQYPKFSLLGIPGATYHITGSIGTNQYQETTDIDIHIIPLKGCDYANEEVQKDVFVWFNQFRDEIDGYIREHPIEVYIQLNPAQEYLSDAVYDITSDTWLKGPTITPIEFDPYEEFSDLLDDIEEETGKADILLGELRRDVIDYTIIRDYIKKNLSVEIKRSLLIRLQERLKEIEQDVEELFRLRGEWVEDRKLASQPTTVQQALSDVEMAKQWRDKNALFKFLNRYNYLKLIGDLGNMIADEDLTDRDVNIIQRMIGV